MSITGWLADWSSWAWPLLIHHLWQATLFSTLAFALVYLLRRGPARARYLIWLIASAKFAIPSMVIGALATWLGLGRAVWPAHSAGTGTIPQSFAAIVQIAEPLNTGVKPTSGHSLIYAALTAI